MKFRYEALEGNGALVRGEVEAVDQPAALQLLRQRDLTPTSLAPVRLAVPRRLGRVTSQQSALLIRELATLLVGGVTLAEAVGGLLAAHEADALAPALARMQAQLQGGTAFALALQDCGLAYPPYVAQMAEAGELTGRLGESLHRAADQLDYDLKIRQEMRGALIYPVVLITAGVAATLIIFLFVVPRFAGILRNPKADVPALSRWVIEAGVFVHAHQAWVLLGALALAGMVWTVFSSAATRARAVAAMGGFPVVGAWLKEMDAARWTAMLGVLLESRVPLVRALDLAREAVQMPEMRSGLGLAAGDVRAGKRLSEALKLHGVLPTLDVNLIGVGERSGEMPRMLATLGEMHASAGRTRMKQFLALLEPVAIVLIGAVIGIIMVAVILGITSLGNVAV